MLAIFWSKTYPLYPFLDRQSFEDTYSDLWKPASTESLPSGFHYVASSGGQEWAIRGDDIPESRRYHILLILMFALASNWGSSGPLGSQLQRSELYWKRCKEVLQRGFDIFTRPRLLFIQALLYMGVWLQSTTGLTGACSNIIAVSIKMSEALGLHSNLHPTDQKSAVGSTGLSKGPEYCSLPWRV